MDQQRVDLFAAVTEDVCHLVGLGEKMLDLVVAVADDVGEFSDAVEGGA